jgi:hypothetical protein
VRARALKVAEMSGILARIKAAVSGPKNRGFDA